MSLTRGRRFIIEQGIGSSIVDFVMNGAISWALFRSLRPVPLWGQHSIASGTLGTTFLLPLLTYLIVAPLTRRRDVAQMSFERFVVFKATLAAMLAAVATPVIVLCTLAERPQGFYWASGATDRPTEQLARSDVASRGLHQMVM
jgi:hypothetical protein